MSRLAARAPRSTTVKTSTCVASSAFGRASRSCPRRSIGSGGRSSRVCLSACARCTAAATVQWAGPIGFRYGGAGINPFGVFGCGASRFEVGGRDTSLLLGTRTDPEIPPALVFVWASQCGPQGKQASITTPPSMGYVARTDTLELYVHECRQVFWTVSNKERVARRRAVCHLSDAGAQAIRPVKVVGAVSVVVLTFLLTVRELPALGPIRIEPELEAILVQPVRATRTSGDACSVGAQPGLKHTGP